MSRDSGPVRPLEQRCVHRGAHWLIEGRDVLAVFWGRSRTVECWTWHEPDGTPMRAGTLAEAREKIRDALEREGS